MPPTVRHGKNFMPLLISSESLVSDSTVSAVKETWCLFLPKMNGRYREQRFPVIDDVAVQLADLHREEVGLRVRCAEFERR